MFNENKEIFAAKEFSGKLDDIVFVEFSADNCLFVTTNKSDRSKFNVWKMKNEEEIIEIPL